MGFGETIQDAAPERYLQYYLRYTDMKELIQELASDQPSPTSRQRRAASAELMDVGRKPVGRFQEGLRVELQKVNQFACVKHEAMFLELRRICDSCSRLGRRIRSMAGQSSSDMSSATELSDMKARIQAMADDIVHLDVFVRLNYVGFQKLTKKFDRWSGTLGASLFVAGLHTEPFCNVRFDDVLILLGLAWSRFRAAENAAEEGRDAVWKAPESFVRDTTKYWIRPDKVVLLKTRIMQHLPYLIFGASTSEQERLLDPFATIGLEYGGLDEQPAPDVEVLAGALEESQLLSSVYFDSPDAGCYSDRIRREEGARLVRFRWYGENNMEPNKDIFVERKIHHEGWGSAQSAKERCILPQTHILQYMQGHFDIEGYFERLVAEGGYSKQACAAMKGICHEVNAMIQEKRLQPIIRTSYYRCAFQLSTSNEVRISLDTQMSLLNEFRADGHRDDQWCRRSSDLLSSGEVCRFPFAILEIKLQNVSEAPLWLRKTLAEVDAIQVHKFSKFQHAMAFLHQDRVSILPHWQQDFEEWRLKKERAFAYGTRTKLTMPKLLSSSHSTESISVPTIRATLAPQGEGHLMKDMQNLDPKSVLANERTLLHYAEKGLYVGAIAVVLVYQKNIVVKGCGVLLVVVTAIYLLWALVEYYSRLGRIVGRSAVGRSTSLRLNWAHGPLLVVFLVVLVAIISVIEACIKAMDARSS
mmetsp:Transcript_69361/g.225177  ORF Transcript_69361/g.225177 Transcript_69361/m.225177 type:complete len:700 (-) Transcript_69361:114-2213(-)